MATKDSGTGGKKPTSNTGRNRNAFCSFCRKSFRDVGPLVEGPADVFICGECIELCQSIIVQEKKRRGSGKQPDAHIPSPAPLRKSLTSMLLDRPVPRKFFPSLFITTTSALV